MAKRKTKSRGIKRSNTAIHRRGPSVPGKIALTRFQPAGRVLDFGCGHGADVRAMQAAGWQAEGFDPVWRRRDLEPGFCLVTCFYVLNVIPSPAQRVQALDRIAELLQFGGIVFLAVRPKSEIDRVVKPDWRALGDGYITSNKTFQAGFTVQAMQAMLETSGLEFSHGWEDQGSLLVQGYRP